MKRIVIALWWLLLGVGLVSSAVACSTVDTDARNVVIEQALNQAAGNTWIPTGRQLRLSGQLVAFLRNAEAAGLVSLHEIPQGYWDNFLNSTQGMGTPFDVTATPKLLGIAVPAKPVASGKSSNPGDVVNIQVRISDDKIDQVTTDDEYKGPLATVGEKYRIVLGTFRDIPTSAAAVVGSGLATQAEKRMRFRCVVKYDQFKKEWSVAALDIGDLDVEQWRSSNVK